MDYVEGKLSPDAKQRMEAQLAQDAALAELVNEAHAAWLRNPDYRAEVLATHEQMLPTWQRLAQPSPAARQWMPKAWLVAAAVAIIALGIWAAQALTGSPLCDLDDPRTLAQAVGLYGQQYSMMSARNPGAIDDGFQAYDQGLYAQTIAQFAGRLDTAQATLAAREMTLCLGIAYFMQGQYDQALPYLTRTRAFTEPRYAAEANWYQALIYRAQGESAPARQRLQVVAKGENHYAEAAQSLLDCE
jgi:anti-sigma factor RsiW